MECAAETLADLLFECDLLLALPSDELFLVSGAAQLQVLRAGESLDVLRRLRGLWVISRGEVEARGGGLACRLQPGEHFSELALEPSKLSLRAGTDVELLWLPLNLVRRLCRDNSSFRKGLSLGSFHSARVAVEQFHRVSPFQRPGRHRQISLDTSRAQAL